MRERVVNITGGCFHLLPKHPVAHTCNTKQGLWVARNVTSIHHTQLLDVLFLGAQLPNCDLDDAQRPNCSQSHPLLRAQQDRRPPPHTSPNCQRGDSYLSASVARMLAQTGPLLKQATPVDAAETWGKWGERFETEEQRGAAPTEEDADIRGRLLKTGSALFTFTHAGCDGGRGRMFGDLTTNKRKTWVEKSKRTSRGEVVLGGSHSSITEWTLLVFWLNCLFL